ncbi:MAG: sulfite exporter TauE/SafE family protein [Candidatus Marsarchaeota archaeon]|nr:sulfite exporter TauE/SafE family protein [Candidatus Marsarchaeota archaeon]
MAPIHSIIIFLAALLAGLLGSLTGLGGGVVLTPLLVLFLGVNIKYALGTSLISTIATSSGAASAYVRDELSNMRVGISLEIGTTSGAITGSLTLLLIEELHLLGIIAVIFGGVLIFSTFPNFIKMKQETPKDVKQDSISRKLGLHGTYYDEALGKEVPYKGRRYPLGVLGMFIAGFMSGLLGIGSGAFKVLAMDMFMELPFKISTATSNFMIGVTAATSSGVYWSAGFIDPYLVAATIPGVLIGALVGAKFLNKIVSRRLRQLFTVVLILLGIQLILHGIGALA